MNEAAQAEREGDEVIQQLVGLERGAPEEATVSRALRQIHDANGAAALGEVLRVGARRLIDRTPVGEMTHEGFAPIFVDGTWLEVGQGKRVRF